MANNDLQPGWNPAPPEASRSNTNWGLLSLIVIGVIVIGAIVARMQGTASSPGGGTSRSIISLSGSGIQKTSARHMEGNYIVNWTASTTSSVGCYHGAFLQSEQVTVYEVLVNAILDSAGEKMGSTNLYGLASADYYVNATSGCDWTFTFTPD